MYFDLSLLGSAIYKFVKAIKRASPLFKKAVKDRTWSMKDLATARLEEVEVGAHRRWGRNSWNLFNKILRLSLYQTLIMTLLAGLCCRNLLVKQMDNYSIGCKGSVFDCW